MNSLHRSTETALFLGFNFPPHPMKNKEAILLPPQSTGEFYSKEKRGLEVSGAVIKAKKDAGSSATIFLPTQGSNVHALFLLDSPDAATTERFSKTLPSQYVAAFNQEPQENVHTLSGLHSHVAATIAEALPQTKQNESFSLAFAHVVPKNGSISHAVIGLTEHTLAIITHPDRDGHKQEAHIVTPGDLLPTDIPGLRTNELLLPAGAQLILTTALTHYQEKGGLEALKTFYTLSNELMTAMQTEQFSSLTQSLPKELLEHVLVAASAGSVDTQLKQFVRKGSDMAIAASLAAQDLATLTTDRSGNTTIPERIAFIASRIPQHKKIRRRTAA